MNNCNNSAVRKYLRNIFSYTEIYNISQNMV